MSEKSNKQNLHARHRQFAELVANGESPPRAYERVGFSARGASAQTGASRLLAQPYVRDYLKKIQADVVEKSKFAAVLSIIEKREFLAAVVRGAIGAVDEKSPLCQSLKVTNQGRSIKMPDKLRAIELDAKLAGELKEGQDGGPNITVVINSGNLSELQRGYRELRESIHNARKN